ncbi:MAG: L-seryl-tRNA(Sec) selenium transferase [Candidatus Krumholzibacteria bacterium]|nr:L-seryl-tRNA(Sec) selenium transferase [Candidatus Krumholzibacteria bacterium]MDP6669623.1 L-seryl-tRNA(Sec) selenium transferase [Candidatus Krumholzibacteria bacterium]MDP6797626.1 L-seryl-tRNA(Sec) selenium transferase [Candidatus Krumholzibacteria bacterium]MDP7021657.1 L-seryl-tRNA(Sec) selenium transferase [Candidatus Krumholzibacteria bacterium]
MKQIRQALQAIPSVDLLLASPAFQSLERRWGREYLKNHLQICLEQYRRDLREGRQKPLTREEILGDLSRDWASSWKNLALAPTRRVLNASGVLLHTNLGRALLSPRARKDVATAASRPVDLELDLETGSRASRLRKVQSLLKAWSGAEDALAVNNNAAALTLAVDTLARRRRLLVSRGEQVEIGGSFRLPEILERFAGSMVELGTTNRTRLSDYASAIRRKGDVILKVHRSNFRQIGYVEEASLEELVTLGREKGSPVIYDLGSGRFDEGMDWLDEPTISDALSAGPSLISFSADKVFGGPQAGLVLGEAKIIDAMRKNPLARALRLDKLSLAALCATISGRMEKDGELPTRSLLSRNRKELDQRARTLARMIREEKISGLRLRRVESEARSGGGAAAEDVWPSAALQIQVRGLKAGRLSALLRKQNPSLLGIVSKEEFSLDLAALQEDELPLVVKALRKAIKERGNPS